MRLKNGALLALATVLLTHITGCGPDMNAVANRLRQQSVTQEREIRDLKEKLAQRERSLKHAEEQLAGRMPRVETLPAERLAELYTVIKVELRPQSDSWEFEAGKGLAGFRVFFRTLADGGMNIPATGNVTIEAFELAKAPAEPRRLGTWTFTPAEIKKSWYAGMGLNQFAVNCPWKNGPPVSPEVNFRLSFTDALTGRVLESRLDKKVSLPTKNAPATTQK